LAGRRAVFDQQAEARTSLPENIRKHKTPAPGWARFTPKFPQFGSEIEVLV
jgi:hypothetical protein